MSLSNENPISLSEAIRLGAAITKPGKGRLMSSDEREACALGGAVIAVPGLFREATEEELEWVRTNPEFYHPERGVGLHAGRVLVPATAELVTLVVMVCRCPARRVDGGDHCSHVDQLYRMVPHLNDDHGWTKDQIADWVERKEKELERRKNNTPAEVVQAD